MPANPPSPSTKPLAQKLFLKPNTRLTVLNAPEHLSELLGPLPDGVTVSMELSAPESFVLLFVRSKGEADAWVPRVAAAMSPKTTLWFAYPKKTSKVATDLTRDHGWEAAKAAGLQAVSQVAVDDVWSALRFRPV